MVISDTESASLQKARELSDANRRLLRGATRGEYSVNHPLDARYFDPTEMLERERS